VSIIRTEKDGGAQNSIKKDIIMQRVLKMQ